MFELFALIAIFSLFMMLLATRSRLKRAEDILYEAAKRIGALQRHAGFSSDGTMPEPAPQPVETVAEAPLAAAMAAADHALPSATQELAEPAPPEPLPPAPTEAEASLPEASEREAAWEPEQGATIESLSPEDDTADIGLEAEPEISAPPEDTGPPISMASRFEELFGRKLPIWAGGITLAIAGVLIVKYAIDAGFFGRIFTHATQVVGGILFGAGLIAGAELAWRNQERVQDLRIPQALSGAGIATLYASVLVAGNVYALISPLAAFVGLALVTASALGLSLRFGAPSALLGLAGGLAAPALVGSVEPNVPMLAVYLGLTIAGLVGVSRMQRWPWLALSALIGGAGWGLWMVLASSALDILGSLSIGGFVLLLAIALPMLTPSGPRSVLLRMASAIVGALQLALLVAYGGFSPLHWGLFALLAAAAQWLAWRDRAFAIVPSIGLALSALLLAIWPQPEPFWFILIGLTLAAIHATPLLARLWQSLPSLQGAMELSALALAAPALAKWHYWDASDKLLALPALGGAIVAGLGAALGWREISRHEDSRFAVLVSTSAALLALAIALLVPAWQIPLGIAIVAAALLFFGKAAGDPRIHAVAAVFAGSTLLALGMTSSGLEEFAHLATGVAGSLSFHALIRWAGLAALFGLFAARGDNGQLRMSALSISGALAYGALAQAVSGWSLPLAMAAVAGTIFALGQRRSSPAVERISAGFAGMGVVLLALTGPDLLAQWSRLYASDAAVGATALLRWGLPAALFATFAWRAQSWTLRAVAQGAAAGLAYGFLAQFVPGSYLMLVPALAGAAALLSARRTGWQSVQFAVATFAVLCLAWAFAPLAYWGSQATWSLAGVPMTLDHAELALAQIAKRLLAPALLLGGALWHMRATLPRRLVSPALGGAVLIGGIAVHCLYRILFAQIFGSNFIHTGLGQRLLWDAVLIGGGWLAMRARQRWLAIALVAAGTAHAAYYTMLLHNPLWAAQAVGTMPLANMLVPAFAMVPLGLVLARQLFAERPAWSERAFQLLIMLMVAGFAWASLRQAFHPDLLVLPGTYPAENILRSLLMLLLAIGFLLWGIRTRRHDWRIASLVLMLAAAAKVFLFDTSGLEGLLRIGSFVALGFSLIGIGWLYSRQLARPAE